MSTGSGGAGLDSAIARHRLHARLTSAVQQSPAAAGTPIAVVDLDAFDRTLRHPGFAGVLAYSLREALWLHRTGADDVVMGYPRLDGAALAEHTNQVHLVSGATVVDTVPTYRGLGHAW